MRKAEQISRIKSLLEITKSGDKQALSEVRVLLGAKNNRRLGEELFAELKAMFSFEPGRIDLIPEIISLLSWIEKFRNAPYEKVCKRPEWKAFTRARGQIAEFITEYRCSCGNMYIRVGTSGFLDWILSLACGNCGDVLFQGCKNKPVPKCACGGAYCAGCSSCGSKDGKVVRHFSQYEYFYTHGFQVINN